MAEFGRVSAAQREVDPTEKAARAAELTEDYLERAKLERHAVPSATRHLLFLLAEGLHLYSEELCTLMEYLQNRQDHLQGEHATASCPSFVTLIWFCVFYILKLVCHVVICP